MYLHKNDSHTWKRRGEKYVQVFFKKGGYKKRVGAFFLLCRVQLLPPLCVNLTIVCFQLPADVTLNKMFKAVIALSEQILQVPIPWLGVLKHTHTQKHVRSDCRHLKICVIKDVSINLWNMTDAHQTTPELYYKCREMKRNLSYLYGIEVHVLFPRPTLMKREH